MYRFVVGTGRCGSTLLSRMLGCHPSVLSFSEFFSTLDRAAVFAAGEFDGMQLAEFLARTNLLNDLVTAREWCYAEGATHKYGREVPEAAKRGTNVPALQIALAQFVADPAPLYDELIAYLRTLPRQGLKDHYIQLFDWLTQRLGKQVWIERSGVSIEFLGQLREWYPQARFLHIHRDGPTTALSIRAFRHFVLYASFFFDPPTAEEMAQAVRGPIDPATDPIVRRMTKDVPSVADFGHYWSWQIACGYRDAIGLGPDQFLEIRYEDLMGRTHETLRQIAAFFELPADADWIDLAAQQVDPEIAGGKMSDLSATEQRELELACLAGQVLLRRVPNNPFEEAMST
ncbi:MAG: sulfotransferase, partial [Steroidobacteraceae bacterium]